MKKIFSIYLLIAFLSYPFTSCMTGGTSASRNLSDTGGITDPGAGWDIDPGDPFAGLEDYDTTDTDGDGVPDWIEEEYGSDPNDPDSIPDLEAALGYDESLDASGMENLASTLGGLTVTIASTLISWGLTANAKMCIKPSGKGNIKASDLEALQGATLSISGGAGSLTLAGGLYTMTTAGAQGDYIDAGNFTISKGHLILKPMGKECVYTYSASIQEVQNEGSCNLFCIGTGSIPYSDLVVDGVPVCKNECTKPNDGTAMATKHNTPQLGWADPIESSKIDQFKLEGIDSPTKTPISLTYSNTGYKSTGVSYNDIDEPRTF
ncbi:MAG: hypothetical protein ABIA04_11905 [Pseudomonadota bacterium]